MFIHLSLLYRQPYFNEFVWFIVFFLVEFPYKKLWGSRRTKLRLHRVMLLNYNTLLLYMLYLIFKWHGKLAMQLPFFWLDQGTPSRENNNQKVLNGVRLIDYFHSRQLNFPIMYSLKFNFLGKYFSYFFSHCSQHILEKN